MRQQSDYSLLDYSLSFIAIALLKVRCTNNVCNLRIPFDVSDGLWAVARVAPR